LSKANICKLSLILNKFSTSSFAWGVNFRAIAGDL
jgi:hypothetical protein